MTYDEKLKIANDYLANYEATWDTLSDINSLHDADDRDEIIELCNERLHEDGYYIDDDEDRDDPQVMADMADE